MTTTPSMDSITEQASDAILTARDFCGSEMNAAREAFLDAGVKPSENDLFNAFQNAEIQWDRDRLAAKAASKQGR